MQQNEKTAKFSKLDFLNTCGLLDRKFNFETLRFEGSLRQRLGSYLGLVSHVKIFLSFYVSTLYERHDNIQLLIGSVYNYLPPGPKNFMGYNGLILVSH